MNISEIVQSAGWKNFMAKLYGIGASVVIVGAMFKIQHWTGGGVMITAGLATEAIIFFFSAFEPLHEELDWTLVYPELAGMTDPDELDEYKDEALSGRGVTLERFDDLFKQAEIQPETIQRLGTGLNSLSKTAADISDISEASVATREYLTNLKSAADSVGNLTDNYSKSTNDLAASVSSLSDTYNKTAELIGTSGKEIAEKFNQSGMNIANSYMALSEKIKADYETISTGNVSFADHLASVNKNLSELNAAYELHLKSANEQMKGVDDVYKGIGQMMKQLQSSVEETQKYKEEMSKLSQHISELNTIYGNMLSALNVR
jgi:gliding motility-associated protein GldL